MSFTSVTVSATYVRGPEQTPAGGEVEFQYSAPMQDSLGNVIATTTPLVVVLDAAGSFSVALPATDDTGVVPTGVTIAVTERIEDARERRYSITLPKAVTAVNLADVAPAIAGPQLFQYALVGHTHASTTLALDDLTDVFAPAPTDLYVLSWVAANSRYELVLPTILGAPSTADYLTGSTQAGLPNEIVVGLTPQGELGGTWGSPTVDASHSGSTHAATQAAAEATAAAALSGHAGAGDPHAGYVLESALDESVDDRVAALIQSGTGISWVYSDALGTLTPTVTLAPFTTTDLGEGTNLYFTDERAQDAVASAATDTASVNVTYNDGANTLVWDVLPAGVDHGGLGGLGDNDHPQYVLASALNESIDDRVASLWADGIGMDSVYDDVLNTFTVTVDLSELSTSTLPEGTNLYYTDERAQDAVGSAATDTASVNVTYNDALGTFVWDVLPAGVDHNSLANLTTGDPHTQYQKESEKGLALGYASLGADVLVPQDQLGTGVQDGTKFLRDDGTWQAVPSGYTDEQAQDAVGGILLDTSSIDFVYSDATPSITAVVRPSSVTVAMLAFDPATQAELDTHAGAVDPHAGYVLESLLDAKGDLISASADNTPGRLAVGTDGQVLSADSTQALGLRWSSVAAGYTDEAAQDAVGSILVDTASINATYNDGVPSITFDVLPAGVDHNSLANLGTGDAHPQYLLESIWDAKGDLISATANDTPARLAAGTNGQVLTAQSAQTTGLLWATLTTTDVGEGTNLYFTDERVDDRVASLWVDGTGIDSVYSDAGGTFTVTVDLSELSTSTLPEGTNLYYTAERAQDDVAAALLDTASIDFTYVDATPSISAAVLPAGVDHNALANITTGDPHTQYLLESIFAAKGDILTATADDTPAILSVGANNTFLRANSAATNGIEWLAIDHGASVGGLGDDDHTQYALLLGRAAGQTLIGGTASGDDLTLTSTSHATKGTIFFGTGSAYDEVNNRWGIGVTSSIAARLQIQSPSGLNALSITNEAAPSTTSGATVFFMIHEGTPTSGHRLGRFGYGALISNSARIGASVVAYAQETYVGGSAQGSYLSFETCALGSAAQTARLRIQADGTMNVPIAGVFGAAVGTAPTNASTALEVNSTTKAILLPRMTTTQRDALTAVDGMVIYNTTTTTAQIRAAGVWTNL